MGFAIFERNRRNIQLTPAGRSFVEAIEKALRYYHAGIEGGHSSQNALPRPITIGYIPDAFNSDIRDIILSFKDACPQVPVTLEETWYFEVYEALANEDLDMVIYTANLHNLPSGISSFLLESYELYAAVYQDHPLSGRDSLRPLELASEPFIELCYHNKSWNVLQYVSKVSGFSLVVSHQTTSLSSTLLQVAAEQGIAIVTKPTKSYWEAIYQENIVFIPLEDLPPLNRVILWKETSRAQNLPLLVDYISKQYPTAEVSHYRY